MGLLIGQLRCCPEGYAADVGGRAGKQADGGGGLAGGWVDERMGRRSSEEIMLFVQHICSLTAKFMKIVQIIQDKNGKALIC